MPWHTYQSNVSFFILVNIDLKNLKTVQMSQRIIIIIIFFIVILKPSCNNRVMNSLDADPYFQFGAYYTKIISGQEWEKYDRTGDYADIIVELGKEKGKFVFWRGASYLPYWENAAGEKFYVDEIIPRKGNGDGLMPDKVNTYSRIALIENTEDRVTIHWRYLPEFSGTNPHQGVYAINFVDEYFEISSEGKVVRTIKKGTEKFDAWNDPGNKLVQKFGLSQKGIIDRDITPASITHQNKKIIGAALVEGTNVSPASWFRFDEATGDETKERFSGFVSQISGDKTMWKKGVSGTALQFDGYKTKVSIPADKAPKPTAEITLEGWIAIGAYPWSWCPIVQQADDVPEEVRLFRGGYDITDIEKREGDLSVGLVGGDPENQEGDVDVQQEIDYDEMDFVVKYQKENDKGYFLGINGHGNPGFKIRVGGEWEELTSTVFLERKNWYHIAATYSKSTGKMKIYVNGEKTDERIIAKCNIELSVKDILIGRGKERRPTDPVRENTFPGAYSFDGLIDEVKIYDVALTEQDINGIYSDYTPDKPADLNVRKLPSGEDRKKFGAYYTNLKFYDSWDNMWRFSKHSDIVVEFDNSPCKFIFWKGVSYIPMMVNDNGFWYSNEFNETWSTSGGEGCQEPMSDKQCLYNYVRIIENTPARAVVHYRFPLVDVNKIKANYVEETGWYDVADWYFYIYPDGVASKVEHLWTSGDRIHEWQESMAIFGPDQHPHDLIEREATFTIIRIDSVYKTYDWNPYPPDGIDEPEHANIHHINYKGEYDPVTIVEKILWSNVYGGEITKYAIFPTWNHWPVAQMPSDGRYASFPDRTCHSSLSHIFPPDYDEQFGNRPYQTKIFLEGMLKQAPLELIPLAKSWIQPPLLSGVKGCTGDYDKAQRAYVFEAESNNISMKFLANDEKPIENICMVFKHWNSKDVATLLIDGIQTNVKQGIVRDVDGSFKLVIWIEKKSTEPINIEIRN
jgi:hypothetical protein